MAFCLSCTLAAAASEQPQQRRRHGTDAALLPPLRTTMDLALRASTAARPHLIDVLNSSAMRARLGPPMASWTAEALLRAVDDIASSAEVLHVTSAGASLFGATNLYSTRLPDSETHEHLARDALYPGLFRSRPVYTALNLIGASTGAPWYGDVSLVLSPAYFAEHGRCVPADSGKLFDCCILKSASCKISAPRLRCEGVVQTPVGRPGALRRLTEAMAHHSWNMSLRLRMFETHALLAAQIARLFEPSQLATEERWVSRAKLRSRPAGRSQVATAFELIRDGLADCEDAPSAQACYASQCLVPVSQAPRRRVRRDVD